MEDQQKTIVYSPFVGDLFHFGHLKSLQFAKNIGDIHICGVLTDEAVKEFRRPSVASFEERFEVLRHISCVDKVMKQDSSNPVENVKVLRQQYPQSKIIVVRGSNWTNTPEEHIFAKHGVQVVYHPYYDKLSDHVIFQNLYKHNEHLFQDFMHFNGLFSASKLTDVFFGTDEKNAETEGNVILSTKANTLHTLQEKLTLSSIEPMYVFTKSDWEGNKHSLTSTISKVFSSSKVVVRSSAIGEDSATDSMAGFFESALDIDSSNVTEVMNAVDTVLDSYNKKGNENHNNQVLVQRQTENISLSGVIFTRQMGTNAPYYIINYDDSTGRTDTITAGVGVGHKLVCVSRFLPESDIPEPLNKVIASVQEIQGYVSNIALDIEFAVNSEGKVIIFQVRPLAVNHRLSTEMDLDVKDRISYLKKQFRLLSKERSHLAGKTSIFAEMPDWNPAEIIGSEPHNLAYSLYDFVITGEVWHRARSSQGYYNVAPAPLVHLFGIKPYVDVRSSFNSFIPATVSQEIREKLLAFFLQKLHENPQLQDKVEFEIIFSCFDFAFDHRSKELLQFGMTPEEVSVFKKCHIVHTEELVLGKRHSISEDLALSSHLDLKLKRVMEKCRETQVSPQDKLQQAFELLHHLKEFGTLPFSRLARLAFIGNSLLKSLVFTSIISQEQYHSFMNSIHTVAADFSEDFDLFTQGELLLEEFLEKYGHLRPGTYDVCTLRYDQDQTLLSNNNRFHDNHHDHQKVHSHSENVNNTLFDFSEEVYQKTDVMLKREGIHFSAKQLFQFIRDAIEARELSKFHFTKNLSFAMELLIGFAVDIGLHKKELAELDLYSLLACFEMKNTQKIQHFLREIAHERTKERTVWKHLLLPPVIRSEKDFDIVSFYSVRPNFIGSKCVEGEVVNITGMKEGSSVNLFGKIVLLESGDPGYDWVFTRNPLALITKYGGVASHMAIRCAEFGLPAAIGTGSLFESLKMKSFIRLDCDHKKIE